MGKEKVKGFSRNLGIKQTCGEELDMGNEGKGNSCNRKITSFLTLKTIGC